MSSRRIHRKVNFLAPWRGSFITLWVRKVASFEDEQGTLGMVVFWIVALMIILGVCLLDS